MNRVHRRFLELESVCERGVRDQPYRFPPNPGERILNGESCQICFVTVNSVDKKIKGATLVENYTLFASDIHIIAG